MIPSRTVNAAAAMLLVRLESGADFGAGRCRGRVEQLATGNCRQFDSVASLLAALTEGASSASQARSLAVVDPAAPLDRDDPHLP